MIDPHRRVRALLLTVLACMSVITLRAAPSAADHPGLTAPPSGCIGDGESGPRVHVMYAVPAGAPDRTEEVTAQLEAFAADMDAMVHSSAQRFGAGMRIRYLQDDDCRPVISTVELTGDPLELSDIGASVKANGFRTEGTRPVVFVDAVHPDDCGQGDSGDDERFGLENNGHDTRELRVAVTWRNCWDGSEETNWDLGATTGLHELMHNFNALQNGTPNSDGTGHCKDGYDVMCDETENPVCDRDVDKVLLDCGGDDYFNPFPTAGSYLATHHNTWWSPWLTPLDGPAKRTARVAGTNRYDTAVAASARRNPQGRSTVLIATGENFADSLAAGPGAAYYDEDLLLVTASGVPTATADRLRALQPNQVDIVGGVAAISQAVEDEIRAILPGREVYRIAGATRVETAADLTSRVDEASTVVLADGRSFTSALVGASTATQYNGVLLLTADGSIPQASIAQLERLAPAQIVVVGAEQEVTPVVEQATAYAGVVQWVMSADPTALSIAAAELANPGGVGQLLIASSANFPDALVASATPRPVVLVPPTGPVPTALQQATDRLGARELVVFGGTSAVADSVIDVR